MARQLVADPKEFESLRGGGASVFDVEHVDDRQEFSVTREAMNDLGIPAGSLDEFGQRQIFDVVAGRARSSMWSLPCCTWATWALSETRR